MLSRNNFICATQEYNTFEHPVPAYYFRKSFQWNESGSATLKIAVCGFYELFFNGQRITKGLLSPYISNLDDHIYYDVYNLQPQPGENVIGILLGNGLRNNPGGELNSIVEVLDYLLPTGPLAHIYYKSGNDSHYTSKASYVDAPVAVLTNGQTASAAELFTAALRDYTDQGSYDATIVGLKTFGKGTLQRFFLMKDGSAFKISVGRYDPPYAENYDGVGILPDVEVALSEEAASINFNKLTDQNDNQLIAAVEALKSK